MNTSADLTDEEASELVVREILEHLEQGRKNFTLRVPQEMTGYLFTGALNRSGLSMVALECLMTEQGISGICGSQDGRVLRRYMSGETRMTWPIYRRLLFWAIANNWIRTWVARDLFFRTIQREAAQLTARKLLRRAKKGLCLDTLTKESVSASFFQLFELQQREHEMAAMRNMERNSEARKSADSLGI